MITPDLTIDISFKVKGQILEKMPYIFVNIGLKGFYPNIACRKWTQRDSLIALDLVFDFEFAFKIKMSKVDKTFFISG